MVTVVPPAVEPLVGVNEVMVGTRLTRLTKAKSPAEVAVPPAVVTEIFTVPAAWATVTALMVEALVTVNDAAAVVPNLTAVAAMRFVPAMVTAVPPRVLPLVGVKLLTVGGAATNL